MAGRRIRYVRFISVGACSYLRSDVLFDVTIFREAVRAKLISSGVLGSNAYVVVAGPANTYAHYVATKEEYAVQRYEGASTIFGQCMSLITFHKDHANTSGNRDAGRVHQQVHESRVIPRGVFDQPAPVGPCATGPDIEGDLASGL